MPETLTLIHPSFLSCRQDPDRDFESSSERYGTLILDIIKLSIVLVLCFIIAAIPYFFGCADGPLPKYVFNISGPENLCYWYGDTGLLDPKNPCPYRGYVSLNADGRPCMHWKHVFDNFKATDFKAGSNERMMFNNITNSQFATLFKDDYLAPVCRRLFKRNPLNKPFCFRKEKDEKEPPTLTECWIVPCTVKIANQCYGKLAQNYGELVAPPPTKPKKPPTNPKKPPTKPKKPPTKPKTPSKKHPKKPPKKHRPRPNDGIIEGVYEM